MSYLKTLIRLNNECARYRPLTQKENLSIIGDIGMRELALSTLN
jgi:hypothetical protein